MVEQQQAPDLCIAVTGVGGGVGQAILRALNQSSLITRIVGLDMNPRGAGLFTVDSGHRLPPCTKPEYVDCLLEILMRENVTILIPGSDPELPVLARARSAFDEAGVQVIVGAPNAVDVCRDKRISSEFFRSIGQPFVRTVSAAEGKKLAEKVGYPLVVKPLGGSASRGVAVVFGPSELESYALRPGYIAQEAAFPAEWTRRGKLNAESVYQRGMLRQEDEISIQVVYDHVGEHLGTFTSVNKLQNGVPTFVDPQRIPEVQAVVEAMADALRERGLVGPCNFQARLTSDGPKVFEINPRFTGITGVRAAMGFNAVDAVLRRAAFNEPVDAVREGLVQPGDQLAIRYVDEIVVDRRRVERMLQ